MGEIMHPCQTPLLIHIILDIPFRESIHRVFLLLDCLWLCDLLCVNVFVCYVDNEQNIARRFLMQRSCPVATFRIRTASCH